ncbi:MAG: universal stress protein [Saprospiraceae bacterium]|nr:universal stress protein [Saprospiraceae bacterium]MBK8450202.1 universal stress protein [Saprospiraceae bacterium]MBK9221157.1 universal stress protein [Saprospiraceae bacterium]MBK9721909.1 universal stress protein [Saprospiraceae bacterium]MBK9728970.1 universal stress protein [Saprospiraceae bacterium]
MRSFSQILCPFDFSEFAEKALDYAVRLTKTSGERLTVLHVLVNPFMFDGGGPILGNNLLAMDLLNKMRDEEQLKLSELKEKLIADNPGLKIDFLVEENNDIGESVIQVQVKLNADLIVIGSHGRKGLKRVFLGSVAEDVLRNAKCPVLVVK